MNNLCKIAVFWVLVACSQSAMAKESIKLVFIGPTVDNKTVMTDEALSTWTVMLQSSQVVDDPSLSFDRLADSYTVDHHVGHGGTAVAINEFRYVPSSGESPGFVCFVNVRGGWASSVGTWFKLQGGADLLLKDILGL